MLIVVLLKLLSLIAEFKTDLETMKDKTEEFIKKYTYVLSNIIKEHEKKVKDLEKEIVSLREENKKLLEQNKALRGYKNTIAGNTVNIKV